MTLIGQIVSGCLYKDYELYSILPKESYKSNEKGVQSIETLLSHMEPYSRQQYISKHNVELNNFEITAPFWCCEKNKIGLFLNYGTFLGKVIIPPDALVYVGKNKLIPNKFVLQDIQPCINIPDDFWIQIIRDNYEAIVYIKNQTQELCENIVKQSGMAIRHVKEQTPDLCKLAVCENGYAIKHIKNITQDLCNLALEQNIDAKRYIPKEFKKSL